MEMSIKKTQKRRKIFCVVTIMLFIILIAVGRSNVFTVKAFPEYELDEDNNMTLLIRQKKASSSTTFKYETVEWFLHTEMLGGNRNKLSSFGPDALPVEIAKRERKEEGEYYYDTITLGSEKLVEWAIDHYTREELIKGQNVFASRSLQIVDSRVSPAVSNGPFYCYEDIVAQADWSSGALRTFRLQTYDQSVFIKLKSTSFTVREIYYDGSGEEVLLGSYTSEKYLYGESVSKTATSHAGYNIAGYILTVGGNERSLVKSSTFSKVLKSSTLGDGDIILTFIYEQVAPPPTQAVMPSPGATIAPVTPTPVVTPTTLPSSTPTTSVTLKEIMKGEEYYFTTDKGYTLNELADSTRYNLAGYMTYYQTGKIGEFTYLKREAFYTIGTDTQGNTWYFIPSGTDATWVHPAVYNGYDAQTSDVQYITELMFPSYVSYNGTFYKVISIGGGASTYRIPGARVTISQSSTTDEGEYYQNVDYSHGWYEELVISSSIYRYRSIGYEYGILGNGAITSIGSQNRDYISSSSPELNYNYYSNYYVYNTTLREITIPETVTTICDNAFLYCEALSVINGGTGVTSIGKKSFMASNIKTATLSFAYSITTSTNTMDVEQNYYYNTSFSKTSKTEIMNAWETAVKFKEYMPISAFTKLKTFGTYSFAYHTNIGTVILPETVTSIGVNAFIGCMLDSITIPNTDTVINTETSNKQNTLGTKGRIRKEERTIIYTLPDANAFTYGRAYKFYYNLMAGYSVNYHPNGGTPNETESYNSVMEDIKISGGDWLTGNFFVHDCRLYSIGISSNGVATITERGVFTMPGIVKEWINRETISTYSGFLYETDDGSMGIWFNGVDDKIPLPSGSTFLGYHYVYNSSLSLYMYVYYATADQKIYRTYRNYAADNYTWSSGYQIFTSAFSNGEYTDVIPYESDSDGNHRFALVSEDSSYDYYYIFYMPNLPTEKIDGDSDAGTEDNYTYKSVSKGTALPDGMKRELADCFYISTDNCLYFSGRYEEESKYITLPYSITGEVYLMDAHYDSQQYAYVKFIDSAGRVFYVRCSDARSTATRYFAPIITYCGQLSSGVAAQLYCGTYLYVDNNGYYYYVTDTDLENNPAFSNLRLEDGSKFQGQIRYGELLKTTTFLLDLDGYYYTLDSYYNDNNNLVRTAKPYMQNSVHFNGLDGEIVERVLIPTGYLHGYTNATSYYYEYYLTDKGTLYIARGSSGATTYLYLEKLTPDGVSLTELMWDRESTYDYLSMFAFDSEGGLWALGRNLYGELGHGTLDVSSGENTQTSLRTLYRVDNGIKFKEIFRFPQGTYALDGNNNLYRTGHFYENKNYIDITGFTLFDVLDEKSSSLIYDAKIVGSYMYLLTDCGCVSFWDNLYYSPTEYVADLGYKFVADIYANEFFIRNGYKFTGWNTAANGMGDSYLSGTRLALTDELDLYAQWEAKAPTIHYNANGGGGGMADTVLPLGTTVTYLAKNRFYRTNYRFKEWNTMPDGSGMSYEDKAYITDVTGEITLYAQWEEVVVTYNLVYMRYPYGSAENSVWKTKTMVNSVSNTTRETIEGQPFIPTGYTVNYDLNRKSSMNTIPVMGTLTDVNTTTLAPTFEKWQLREPDADGEHQYYGDNFAPGDVVSRLTNKDGATLYLYPTWGGSGGYVLLPDAICEGYTLLGWCEVADGSSEIYYPNNEDSDEVSTYVPVKDTTLYAVWEADKKEQIGDFQITGTSDDTAAKLLESGMQALVLKTGYNFSYAFYISGSLFEKLNEVKISPKYVWISKDEAERKEAQVYYHALVNGKREYFLTAGSEHDTRNEQKNGSIVLTEKIVENEIQTWEGSFSLPTEVFVVWEEKRAVFEEWKKQGPMTGEEEFFVKTGFLSVVFQVELQLLSGEQIIFDFWQQTEGYQDAVAAGWNWSPGDVIRYDLERSSAEDYTVGGVE